MRQCRNQFPPSTRPLRSPKDSPEVSCDEKEVEVVAGEREVLASEDPSDMEGREELGEVGGSGLKPSSEKCGCSRALLADTRSSAENTNSF